MAERNSHDLSCLCFDYGFRSEYIFQLCSGSCCQSVFRSIKYIILSVNDLPFLVDFDAEEMVSGIIPDIRPLLRLGLVLWLFLKKALMIL